jgi:HSP20 family molecular chaperone IbpA
MAMHELSDESDNLFREIQSISNAEGSLEPLINIREEASEFIISADLPFVKKEGITIYTTERSLEIQARMYKDVTFERGNNTAGDIL